MVNRHMEDRIKYDYLIVGSGLSGAVFAHEVTSRGKRCLVLEKRGHIGGNVYTETIAGVDVHRYGPHIFHTDDREVWEFACSFCEFNHFINSPIANYRGEIYNLPFNMNTFNRMWGVVTPGEALEIIGRQRKEIQGEPQNLEEQAIRLVGRDVYEKLIKGYTEKQWGRPCAELPAFIITRLPVRLVYDNNYFSHAYQGIPKGGYTPMIEAMLQGCDIRLHTDYLADKSVWDSQAKATIYTGMPDAYFGYSQGCLEYRSLRFEDAVLDKENFQGVAVVNYTDRDTPYTRIIEHKHFAFGKQEKTVVTREYPQAWQLGLEAYYPVNDEKNKGVYAAYSVLMEQEHNTLFLGRLALYRYLDMDQTIRLSLDAARRALR